MLSFNSFVDDYRLRLLHIMKILVQTENDFNFEALSLSTRICKIIIRFCILVKEGLMFIIWHKNCDFFFWISPNWSKNEIIPRYKDFWLELSWLPFSEKLGKFRKFWLLWENQEILFQVSEFPENDELLKELVKATRSVFPFD